MTTQPNSPPLAKPAEIEKKDRPLLIDFLKTDMTRKRLELVATKYLSPERVMSLTLNAVSRTPLLKACTVESVLGSLMTTTALGLEPNTPRQLAYLIPYRRSYKKKGGGFGQIMECQFQIGYRGFIELGYRSPTLLLIQGSDVHAGDLFEHQMGSETFLRFRQSLKNRGPMIGAFAFAKMARSSDLAVSTFEIIDLEEIYKIRSKSEAYRSAFALVDKAKTAEAQAWAKKKYDETPWVMWEDEMAIKSAIKRLFKRLPLMSEALDAAVDIDNAASTGHIDTSKMIDPAVIDAIMTGTQAVPEVEEDAGEEGDDPTPKAKPPANKTDDAAATGSTGATAAEPGAGGKKRAAATKEPAAAPAGEPKKAPRLNIFNEED
mgnify:CR=1 FL=1